MKIVVTGHTGFIGSNMYRFLNEKESVNSIGYSRSTGQDILNREQLGEYVKDCDLVFHFAAFSNAGKSIPIPVDVINSNVNGTLNVLEACRKYDAPVVYSSTCDIYGDSDGMITEEDEMKPCNPYAASKIAGDRICFCYHRAYGVDTKIVRLFNAYGTGQQLFKIVPVFYFQAMKNKPITVYGKGGDSRDYIYIDDLVRGLWMARDLPSGDAINLATGCSTSNLEMAQLIIKLTNSDSEISFVDYPKEFGNVQNQVGSYDKAKKLLGWSPKVSLEEGIKRTIKWLETLKQK